MNFLKRFLAFTVMALVVGGFVLPAQGAMTNSVDAKPNSLWWSGDPWGDTGWLFLKEVETIIETWGLEGTVAFDDILLTPGTAPTATEGTMYYDAAGDVTKFRNASAWVTLETSAGNSLDTSYDAGIAITVDAGAVALTATDAANNVVLAIDQEDTGATVGMTIVSAGTGALLSFDANGASNDVLGSDSTWSISKAGAVVCVGLDTTGDITLQNDEVIKNDNNGEIEFGNGTEDTAFSWAVANTLLLSSDTGVDKLNFGDVDALSGLSTVAFDAAAGSITLTADAGTEDLTIQQAGVVDASVHILGDGTGADAITLVTTAGGIDITVAGAADGEDLDLTSDAAINLVSSEAADIAIVIQTSNAAGQIFIDSADTTADGIDIDSAGGIDIDVVDTATIDTSGAGKDIRIDSAAGSVYVEGAEAAADAVVITASAGGVDISAAATFDIDVTATGGKVLVVGNENAAGAVSLLTSGGGGTSETIVITNDQGTGDDSINIDSTAGGLDIAVAKELTLSSSEAAADACQLTASAGGVDISTAATFDVDITATGGTVQVIASEAAANQFKVDAQGIVAGNAIVLETTDGGVQINADGADNGDIAVDAGDDLTLTAAGDLILAVTGAVNAGTSPLTNLYQSVNASSGGTTLAATDSNKVYTNIGDADGELIALPAAAAGLKFTFVVVAAQTLTINPFDGVDIILGLTNAGGDAISSAAPGDVITLLAVDATNWVAVSSNNSNGNADAWVDAN